MRCLKATVEVCPAVAPQLPGTYPACALTPS